MAHRIFHAFPTANDDAERIEEFSRRLRAGSYQHAPTLCPIEGFNHALAGADEIEQRLRQQLGDRDPRALAGNLAAVEGDGVSVERRGDNEAWVTVRFVTGVVGRFALTTNGGDRWSMWFEGVDSEL